MNIYLFCCSGVSTSLLATKMQKAANEKNIKVNIEAFAETKIKEVAKDADVILLGPQVGFKKDKIMQQFPNKPISVINMQDYGLGRGDKVLDEALELIE